MGRFGRRIHPGGREHELAFLVPEIDDTRMNSPCGMSLRIFVVARIVVLMDRGDDLDHR